MSSHGPGQAGCTWLALGFSMLLIFGEKGWVENWKLVEIGKDRRRR
jgi:hypothetical protein